jgi:acyl dehydratase
MTAPVWAELTPGAAPSPFVDTPLTVTDFVRYQGASGDMNPVHHDSEFARRAGYDKPLAVGMLPAGIAASYLTAWLGAANIRRFKVQFRNQAWPGDVLTYSARVMDVVRDEDRCRADVEVDVARPDGTLYLKGWATFERADD